MNTSETRDEIESNRLLGRAILDIAGVGCHSIVLEDWPGHLRGGSLIVNFTKWLGRDWRHWQETPDMAITLYSLLRFAGHHNVRDLEYIPEKEITTSPFATFTFEVVT